MEKTIDELSFEWQIATPISQVKAVTPASPRDLLADDLLRLHKYLSDLIEKLRAREFSVFKAESVMWLTGEIAAVSAVLDLMGIPPHMRTASEGSNFDHQGTCTQKGGSRYLDCALTHCGEGPERELMTLVRMMINRRAESLQERSDARTRRRDTATDRLGKRQRTRENSSNSHRLVLEVLEPLMNEGVDPLSPLCSALPTKLRIEGKTGTEVSTKLVRNVVVAHLALTHLLEQYEGSYSQLMVHHRYACLKGAQKALDVVIHLLSIDVGQVIALEDIGIREVESMATPDIRALLCEASSVLSNIPSRVLIDGTIGMLDKITRRQSGTSSVSTSSERGSVANPDLTVRFDREIDPLRLQTVRFMADRKAYANTNVTVEFVNVPGIYREEALRVIQHLAEDPSTRIGIKLRYKGMMSELFGPPLITYARNIESLEVATDHCTENDVGAYLSIIPQLANLKTVTLTCNGADVKGLKKRLFDKSPSIEKLTLHLVEGGSQVFTVRSAFQVPSKPRSLARALEVFNASPKG